MKVPCEHTPLLTTGLTAEPVQPRILHLTYPFPHLIPFHTSLPNFPFQCSFPTPHLPSRFLFPSFTLSFHYLPPRTLLTSGQSQISSQPIVWHCPSTSQRQVLSLPSPPGSLLQPCWGFLFAFPSAFPPSNYRLAQCHARAAGTGNCRESPIKLLKLQAVPCPLRSDFVGKSVAEIEVASAEHMQADLQQQ